MIKRFLGAPFLHFLVLGALIFMLYAGITGETPDVQEGRIIITNERVAQLQSRFRQVWLRDPAPEETENLVQEFIREEILYREALALGLDRDDQIVRNRLRYKLDFLADSGAQLLDPGDEELQAFVERQAERYRIPPRVAFRQIYLGETPTAEDVDAIRSAIGTLDEGDDFRMLGVASLLPAEVMLADPREVDGIFGKGFTQTVLQQPLDIWGQPFASSFGYHLVRLLVKEPGRLPELEEIRPAVLRDWQAAKAQEVRDLQLERLRERYEIVRESGPAQ